MEAAGIKRITEIGFIPEDVADSGMFPPFNINYIPGSHLAFCLSLIYL
jgi:hypothetical protein